MKYSPLKLEIILHLIHVRKLDVCSMVTLRTRLYGMSIVFLQIILGVFATGAPESQRSRTITFRSKSG